MIHIASAPHYVPTHSLLNLRLDAWLSNACSVNGYCMYCIKRRMQGFSPEAEPSVSLLSLVFRDLNIKSSLGSLVPT